MIDRSTFQLQDDVTGGTGEDTQNGAIAAHNGAQVPSRAFHDDGLAGFRDAILRGWRICQDLESDVAWVTVSEKAYLPRKRQLARRRDAEMTTEERDHYNANRRAKRAARTPEQRAADSARLAARRRERQG